MRKLLIGLLATVLLLPTSAHAHQPVILLDTETTAARGPLLVDGTISFAIRAAFTKSNQKKGFRFGLKEGEDLNFEYLIIDKAPENKLKNTQLPQVVITAPNGSKTTLKFNERSKFSYSGTNYLYLYRSTAPGKSGTYSVDISSKAKAAITLVVGEKEIPGDVLRGVKAATPTPTPTPTPSATPTANSNALTLARVKENNTASSCWSIINGNVYNLTNWISSHPGGKSAITSLCGIDGTSTFNSQHRNESKPESRLASYLLGKLTS
jgi:cytochrome b involved in lipid metabolism